MDDNFIDLSSIQRTKKPEQTELSQPKAATQNFDASFLKDAKIMSKSNRKHSKKHKQKDVTEDELIDKRRMILILQFYLLEFPDKLQGYQKINFDKKTTIQLHEIRNQMDGIISSQSSLKQTQMLITSSIKTIEFATTYLTPVRCQGLANTMMTDPSTLDDIKHIALKRMSLVNCEPEYRLIYKLISNMMLLHNINSNVVTEQPKKVHNEKIQEISNKYMDI